MSAKEPLTFNILHHKLVPKHTILSEEEKKALLEKLNITEVQLPKILAVDPAVKAIDAKVGDVVKIERESHTAGNTVYYRLVVKM
ncbi:MAG: DNA-directed RNA polymerase subunit H [Candidatus Aenigmatarchaeota archaeon]